MKRTLKTMTKRNESKNGLNAKDELNKLITSISIAKGTYAIVLSELKSDSIKEYRMKVNLEHLRILSQEVMDEIWNAELAATNLNQILKKKHQGICLL